MESETIRRSYKYRLYPTKEQSVRLHAWQVACREVQQFLIQWRRDVDTIRRARQHLSKLAAVSLLPLSIRRHSLPVLCLQMVRYLVSLGYIQERMARWGYGADAPKIGDYGASVTRWRKVIPGWGDVPSTMLITNGGIVGRVKMAYQRFFKNIKQRIFPAGQPRWAQSPDEVGLFFKGSTGTRITRQSGRDACWLLSDAHKLGEMRVRMHRPLPDDAEVKTASITRSGNDWYISFSCVVPQRPPLPATGKTIGVDLNCKHEGKQQAIAAVSDGRVYSQEDTAKRYEHRRRTLERLVSPTRKTRGSAKPADPTSNRTQRRRRRIAQIRSQETRSRRHTQEYVAKRLIATADVIGLEDINLANLKRAKKRDGTPYKRGGRRLKRNLNRSLSSAAPGQLRALIVDKATVGGRQAIVVSARNTTQSCSQCGCKNSVKIQLSVRRWQCDECGAWHNRDINAARNIEKRAIVGTAVQAEACAGTSPSTVQGETEMTATAGQSRSQNPEGTDVPTVESVGRSAPTSQTDDERPNHHSQPNANPSKKITRRRSARPHSNHLQQPLQWE